MKPLYKAIVLLVFFILLGYFREYVFINFNNLIYFKFYKSTTMPIPSAFLFFTKFSYATLYYVKYPLTITFVAIYIITSIISLKFLRMNNWYQKLLLIIYGIIILLSVILMIYGYFFKLKLNDNEYTISRWLMGIAQSPFILFTLITLYLWEKTKLIKNEKGN